MCRVSVITCLPSLEVFPCMNKFESIEFKISNPIKLKIIQAINLFPIQSYLYDRKCLYINSCCFQIMSLGYQFCIISISIYFFLFRIYPVFGLNVTYCFENMALTLSEEVIRNRVNLQHDNLGKKLSFKK